MSLEDKNLQLLHQMRAIAIKKGMRRLSTSISAIIGDKPLTEGEREVMQQQALMFRKLVLSNLKE